MYTLAVLVKRRANMLGRVLVPYVIREQRLDGAADALYADMIEPATQRNGYMEYTSLQLQLVNLLAKLDDRVIEKRFFGGRSEFKKFVPESDSSKTQLIEAYADEIQLKAISLMEKMPDLPIYLHQDGYTQLYEADRIVLNPFYSKVKLVFSLKPEGTLFYNLGILTEDKDGQSMLLPVFKKKVVKLTGKPASVVVGRRIVRFKQLDFKMLYTFVQNHHIEVQAKNVPMYMNNFVSKAIANHYVEAHGFRIIKKEAQCSGLVTVKDDVLGHYVELGFLYDGKYMPYKSFRRSVELQKRVEGEPYVFVTVNRNVTVEESAARVLQGLGLDNRKGMSCVFRLSDASTLEACITWLQNNRSHLEAEGIAVGEVILNDRPIYVDNYELVIEADEKPDWFDVHAVVRFDGFSIPFAAFRKHILENNDQYFLPNGKVFIIPREWFTLLADLALCMPSHGKPQEQYQLGKQFRHLLAGALPQNGAFNIASPCTVERLGEVRAVLRNYQHDGFQWLANLQLNDCGGILADDMGLGKTLQTICMLAHFYASNPDAPMSIIVMPKSLVHNWKAEIFKFSPQLYAFNFDADHNLSHAVAHRVVLVSYAMLRGHVEQIAKHQYSYLILDESQFVKNPGTMTYKAVLSIEARHRLLISGTPIENGLADLWAQMNIANPGLLGSNLFFRNYFERNIRRSPDGEHSQRLKNLITPFMLRRTKEMVAQDLPPVVEQVIMCPMSAEQHSIYEKEKSGVRNEFALAKLERGDVHGSELEMLVLTAITRLRMLAIHPMMLDEYADAEQSIESGKFEVVLTYLRNAISEGHKVLVFSAFVRDLRLLESELQQMHIAYSMIVGDTTQREAEVKRFREQSNVSVFLLGIKSGGVGLNLTEADYVFFLNPWWNPQVEQQALARAHRIGQQNTVFVYRFISQDSIEEKILNLQKQKLALAEAFEASANPFELLEMEVGDNGKLAKDS